MTIYFDYNPTCVDSSQVGSRSPGRTKETTDVRLARLDVRGAKSQDELEEAKSTLYQYLYHKRLPMYVLNCRDIPFGVDEENIKRCLMMANIELSTVYFKPTLSEADMRKFGQAIFDDDQEQLWRLYHKIEKVTQHGQIVHPHLQTEAVKAQTLIALQEYERASHVLDLILSIYPYDDFCMYCKAEVLIDQPVSWFLGFFGQDKSGDLIQAHAILKSLMSPQQDDETLGVPMYQSKHDLVWAKYRLRQAECADGNSVMKNSALKRAMKLAMHIGPKSIYHSQAQKIIEQCRICLSADTTICRPNL